MTDEERKFKATNKKEHRKKLAEEYAKLSDKLQEILDEYNKAEKEKKEKNDAEDKEQDDR